MNYAAEHIPRMLKSARQGRGLSQRELSAKSGVPQSHISKIEKGAVDLRVSSLTALARVLDLELTLVPRKTVPAVNSLVRSAKRAGNPPAGPTLKQLNQLRKTLDNITKSHSALKELAQLQHQVRGLQRFELSKDELDTLSDVNRALQTLGDNTKSRDLLNQALAQIHSLRNALAHSFADLPQTDSARPAYSLEEEEDDDG